MALEAPPGEVFNVGGGETATVLEVLRLMQEVTGRKPRLQYQPARPGDQQATAANTSKLRRLGWEPATRLVEGLAKQWTWRLAEAATPL